MSKQSAEYWRERKRLQRLKAKGLDSASASVGSEIGQPANETGGVSEQTLLERLPWPYNKGKSPRWGEGVEYYVAPTLDEQLAVKEMEVLRVRAKLEEKKREYWRGKGNVDVKGNAVSH